MKHTINLQLQRLSFILFAIGLLALSGCQDGEEPIPVFTEQDKSEIETLARQIPLILANDGWEAYQSHFAAGYQNWSMVADQVRSREEYLGMVKAWYEAGNRATGSEIESIGFIPVAPNLVLYLNAQQEVFLNPQDSTQQLVRDIRFVSVYKKEGGRWKNSFTAFMDAP